MISFEPVSPADRQLHAIEVPQGCLGISTDPDRHPQLRFMTTQTALCVAVALVGFKDDSDYPVVVLAHLDSEELASDAVQYMLASFSQAVPLHETTAYVLNGCSNPPLLRPIRQELNRAGLKDCFVHVGDYIEPLTIDLETGKPVLGGRQDFST